MSITTKWYDKNKSEILTCFYDQWTIEDFIETRKKWYRSIKSVDYTVSLILDLSQTFTAPQGILHQFIAMHRTPHPRQGHILAVGLNPLYVKLSQHLFDGATAIDKQVIQVTSIVEALQIVRHG